MQILIDPRVFETPTGFGVAVGDGPSDLDRANPHVWAISGCCAYPIHFRYRSGEQYHVCSSCDRELKFKFHVSGVSVRYGGSDEIQSYVRQWTGLDNLDVSIDVSPHGM